MDQKTPPDLWQRLRATIDKRATRRAIRSRLQGFAFLKDCPDLSQRDLARATSLISAVKATIAGRGDYLTENDLDATLWAPTAHWGGVLKDFACYQGLLSGEPLYINRLRQFAFMFTGLRLSTMAPARPDEGTDVVLDQVDDKLKHLAGDIHPAVIRYAQITRTLPEGYHLAFPRICGEVGWQMDDQIINPDTAVYIERIALMQEAGILDQLQEIARTRPPRILEIGSGFGGLAFMLRQIVPGARLVLTDLPESLAFAACWLGAALPESGIDIWSPDSTTPPQSAGISILPNYAFPALCEADTPFDLVINTLSMSEMPPEQVAAYASGISALIGSSGCFFEQNQDNRHLGLIWCKEIIAPYFSARNPVSGKSVPGVTQGQADIWRN